MPIRDCLYDIATDKYRGFGYSIVKFPLLLLSFAYSLSVRFLIYFYGIAPRKLDCKVISVGNITLGGTGKTSLVEFVARYLKQKGHKVAILSRGYKKKPSGLNPQVSKPESMGDEPYMLSKNLVDIPVIVDTDRARASGIAVREYGVDTVILDDGFQQWRIKKDLEIVTIDARNPFGNRCLIPRGILREPLSSLKRADVFVLSKVNLNPDVQDTKDFLGRVNPFAQVFESEHRPKGFYDIRNPAELLNTDVFKQKTVTLVSGIADPDSFEDLIRVLGINIGLTFRFQDHHDYTPEDLEKITAIARNKNMDTVITTEKDAARLFGGKIRPLDLNVFVLRISFSIINDEDRFCNRLLKLYSL